MTVRDDLQQDVFFVASPDLLASADMDGKLARTNPAWQTCLGWSEDELRGVVFASLVHDEDRPRLREVLAGHGADAATEVRVRTRDNGWRCLAIRIHAVPTPTADLESGDDGDEPGIADSDAPAAAIHIVARDVTDYRGAEQARSDRMRRYHEALSELTRLRLTADRANLPTIFRAITATSAEALDVDRCSVWLFVDDRARIECVYLHDAAGGEPRTDKLSIAEDDAPGYLLELGVGSVLAVADIATDARTADLVAYCRQTGVTALLDAPILVDGQLVGVVCHEQRATRDWSLDEQHFAGSIADLVAIAIGTANLHRTRQQLEAAHDSLTRRLEIERLMSSISAELAGVADTDPSVAVAIVSALGQLGETLGAQRGWLFTSGDGFQSLDGTHIWSDPPGAGCEFLATANGDGMPDWWLATVSRRAPVIVGHPATLEAGPFRDALTRHGIHSMINVPVYVGEALAGVVGFAWLDERRAPGRELAEIASHVEMAGHLFASVLEREATAAALRASEQRFRLMAETVEKVFYLANPLTGETGYISPRFEEVFGFPAAEMFASVNAFFDRIHPDDMEEVRRLMDVERVVDVTYRYHHPDGRQRWLRTASYPIPEAVNPSWRVAGFSEDVTARVEAENELLERERQLRQAQKMEAFGQLAGGVAHDFNNLLTAITGTAQLARELVEAGHPVQRDLADILKAGVRAADLTRQLLAFARRQVFAPVNVNINEAVGRMQRMLRRLIRANIDMVTDLDPDAGAVRVDPGQLEQVIVNLVVNASDSMPDGGRLILRSAALDHDEPDGAELDLPPGRYVTLAVEDTGCGIPDDVRPRIFDPFFTTKPTGIGTGLGLSTCYGIVRQSGGAITVDTEAGRGSTFRVWFPRVEQPDMQVPLSPESSELPRGTETLLLVEDEPMVRKLTTRILTRLGYQVLQAINGEEALGIIDARGIHTIDLLITDVIMPRMGGPELVTRVRERRFDQPVIFVSGYSDEAVGAGEPHTRFIQKPFSMQTLATRIREILERD